MRKIPFSPPDITEAEIDAVSEVLRSGWITTGPKTKEFEKRIAAYCGTNKAACLGSATAAMECTLRLLGIGPGDEVITTAYTYTATASAIFHTGAKIVLCDTQKDCFEMDYERLPDLITEKTKAILPVDIGGKLCDYDKVFAAIEQKAGLFCPANELQAGFARPIVIADSAHAFGAERHGVRAGAIADFTCFSFHAIKNLTTAEGGAVTWKSRDFIDDEQVYRSFMLLSLHGQDKDALAKTKAGAWEYDIVAPLYKCNMTDIMAAIGLTQLSRYDGLLQKRRDFIRIYDEAFADAPVCPLQHKGANDLSSGHLYMLRIFGADEQKRNRLIERMAENGVATNVHFKPLPLLTAYRNLGFAIADYPNAYHLYENEITLPLHTKMTAEDVAYTAQTLKELL